MVACDNQVHPGAGPFAQQSVDLLGQRAGVMLAERPDKPFPSVEQQQQVRQPLLGVRGPALLGDIGEAALTEQLLAAQRLLVQPAEQPDRPFSLAALHDRPGVRQFHQRQQRAVTTVQTEKVHISTAGHAGR